LFEGLDENYKKYQRRWPLSVSTYKAGLSLNQEVWYDDKVWIWKEAAVAYLKVLS
jgi:hypothetical protein